jgi:hypothetical protein
MPRWDDKLEALHSFRKSKGLCFTCGEKWSRTHKCPTQVPLHVLEELLDALPPRRDTNSDDDMSSGDELMCIDVAAVTRATPSRRRMICLHGHVKGQEVLILVDSGSGASFIDNGLDAKLRLPACSYALSEFMIANGETMVTDQMIPQLSWCTQAHTFQQDMKILPLGCYDIILGGNWLEDFSTMWVHWLHRHMRFKHKGERVMLQEIQDYGTPGRQIIASQLQGLLHCGVVEECVCVQPVH